VKAIKIYSSSNRQSEAIEIARKVLNIDKTNIDASAMMAEDLIRQGKNDEAAEMFKDVLINVAERNDVKLGAEIARRAMELQIEYGKQFYAYFLFKDNRIEEAKRMLESEYALTQEEKVLLGKIYYKTHEYPKAKAVLLSLDPEVINQNVEIMEQIGDVLLKLTEHKAAGEYYFRAFRLLKQEAKLDAAISMGNKVQNVDSENPALHEALAEIYTAKNMKNQILDEYIKLVRIYEKTGKKEELSRAQQMLSRLKML